MSLLFQGSSSSFLPCKYMKAVTGILGAYKDYLWPAAIEGPTFSTTLFLALQVYMPGFLSSNLYYKYLSDLINSVRADEFVNVSGASQGGQADGDRSGSNASDGPQMQVTLPFLTSQPFPSQSPDIFTCLLLFTSGLNAKEVQSLPLLGWYIEKSSRTSAATPLLSCSFQHGARKAAIKILKNFDEAITVDVASLDPDNLYQRPYAG